MRRVLLDHCVPRGIQRALVGCDVATAYQRGWSGLKNGALLQAAEGDGFDVLVTADKNLRYQQNLANRLIAIVELPTNSLPKLRVSPTSLMPSNVFNPEVTSKSRDDWILNCEFWILD